jgi:hypothetical protein
MNEQGLEFLLFQIKEELVNIRTLLEIESSKKSMILQKVNNEETNTKLR